MKSFKKVLALILSLAMVMTTLTVTAFADTQEKTVGELNDLLTSANHKESLGTQTYKLSAEGNISTWVILSGEDITLDLNGKKLTRSGNNLYITINAGGKFTLTDSVGTGSFYGYGSGSTSYQNKGIYNSGTFVLDGAKITHFNNKYTGSSSTAYCRGAAIYNNAGEIIINEGSEISDCLSGGAYTGTSSNTYAGASGAGIYNYQGTVTINGGTFKNCSAVKNSGEKSSGGSGQGGFYYAQGVSGKTATLTINGGTFTNCSADSGDIIGTRGYTKIYINGGTFIGGDTYSDMIASSSTNKSGITGGWFSAAPDGSYPGTLSSGYYLTGICADAPNEDAPYTVVDSETYTINYLSNDGGESVVTADVVTHKNDATLADYTPTEGTFMGWATAEGATEADYAAGATFQEVAASETNLYAVVTQAQTATATFYDGATELPDYSTTTVAGSTITLPEALSKEGFVFNGWNDGNETYDAGADYTLEADTEFNADWTARTAATLDFYLDTAKIPSLTVEGYVDDVVTLPDLGITGYVLTGWATTQGATEPDYVVGADYTIASATDVLYAVYEEAVAKATIGGKDYYYLSLADALTDLDSISGTYTATITLLKDDTQTARVNLTTRTNATKAVITIDFNGKTLTYTGSNSGFVNVRAYNSVTITGEGTVDVSGATYKRLLYADVANASATVLNGNFATVVDDGSNTAFDFCSKMVINGGTWGADPEQSTKLTLPSGFASKALGTEPETWEVYVIPVAKATLNGGEEQEFASLADAFNYVHVANGDAVITLLDDVELSQYINLGAMEEANANSIKLDMNGKTITFTQNTNTSSFGFIYVRAYTTLTITGEGAVDVTAAKYFFRANRYAKIIIENGTFTGAPTELGYYNYADNFDIRGGSFSLDLTQTHTHDTPTLTNLINYPYIQELNETTDFYDVKMDPDAKVVATYDGAEYYTFDEVLEAAIADEGDEALITLTGEDLGKSYTITNPGKKLIFDLDGKTMALQSAHRVFRFEKGEFELRNGKILANGALTINGYFYADNAKVTFDNFVFNADPTDGQTRTTVATSNGGFMYARASEIVLNETSIKNCYDEASSGAFHLAKNTVEGQIKGSSLLMLNSTIINCAAGVHGGAVSVGSYCELTMKADPDDSNVIDECEAPRGGAIYVDIVDDVNLPATGDHTAGQVYILDGAYILDCKSTDALSDAPIYSNGFVYNEDPEIVEQPEIIDDGDVYQMQTNAVFDTVSGTVGEKISLRFFVKVAYQTDKTNDVKLAYTYDDVDYEIDPEEAGNYLEFVVDNINLYDAAKEITFYVKDEYIASNAEIVSAQDYFNMLEATYFGPDRNEVLTFCAQTLALANDLVVFSATQEAGQKGAPVSFAGWEEEYILDNEPSQLDSDRFETDVNGKTDTDKIAGVALNVTDQLAITYMIYTTKGSFITVTNSSEETMEVVDGEYIYTSTAEKPWYVYQEKLSPLVFDEVFTITMLDMYGGHVHTITYSVNSYCYTMFNNPNASTELQNLVLSIYRFGLSAKSFNV